MTEGVAFGVFEHAEGQEDVVAVEQQHPTTDQAPKPRRHLDESQRAMVGAKLANLRHGQKKADTAIAVSPVSQPEAAKLVNVSVDSIQRAAVVQREGSPEVIKQVERGVVSVSAAAEKIKKERPAKSITEKSKPAAPKPPEPGPRPSPTLDRDQGKIAFGNWLKKSPRDCLEELAIIIRGEMGRVMTLSQDARNNIARDLLKALTVQPGDLR